MQTLSNFRKPPCGKTMGIELEVLQRYEGVLRDYQGFFYATRDGSIQPFSWIHGPGGRTIQSLEKWEYGREYVSQPLTPEWLKKEIVKLAKKTQWLVNSSCGIHIHVSKAWCSKARARSIFKFYCDLTQSERIALFGRGSNEYCEADMRRFAHTRYNAVNVENAATTELRMFASGDAQWACYCVDMAVWLVHNAKHLNLDSAFAEMDRLNKLHNIIPR